MLICSFATRLSRCHRRCLCLKRLNACSRPKESLQSRLGETSSGCQTYPCVLQHLPWSICLQDVLSTTDLSPRSSQSCSVPLPLGFGRCCLTPSRCDFLSTSNKALSSAATTSVPVSVAGATWKVFSDVTNALKHASHQHKRKKKCKRQYQYQYQQKSQYKYKNM